MKNTAAMIHRHNDPKDPLHIVKLTSASGIVFYTARYNIITVDESTDTITFIDSGVNDGIIEAIDTPLSTVDLLNYNKFDPDKDLSDEAKAQLGDKQLEQLRNIHSQTAVAQKEYNNFKSPLFDK